MGLNGNLNFKPLIMRSILRSLALSAATLLGMASMAQPIYTWVISGTVPNCNPNQVVTLQTIQGTIPQQTLTVALDSNCMYWAELFVSSSPAWIQASTPCNGQMINAWDSASFNLWGDTAYSVIDLNCGGGPVDCLGVPNGTALPGTPCDDGDPMTYSDTWDANCNCVGVQMQNCQADFTVQQNAPWQITTVNNSTGVPPIDYVWWLPDGSLSNAMNPSYTFTQAGVYGICLTITADSGYCTSVMCDTLVVDSSGMISNNPVWYDCLGNLWGPAMPGTPCDDGDPNTFGDAWTNNCNCVGMGQVDCLGIPGGPNQPGTACTDTIPGGGVIVGIWNANCVCMPNGLTDCLGIPGGPNMPGTPCDDGNPATTNDMWDANCTCAGTSNAPCQADFWVIQAYTTDSMGNTQPIPNELWLWNLSSGGSGTYTYLWDFGDGNTSTDPFPTHTYAGNGPYMLCLTIDDGLNCISTHCDTVAIDSSGLYTGMIVMGNTERSSTGFTLNVQNPGANGMDEALLNGEPTVWPNPVQDQLNVAFELQQAGRTEIMVLDMQGRVLLHEAGQFGSGPSLLRLPSSTLSPGMYTLRLSSGKASTAVRFVKVD